MAVVLLNTLNRRWPVRPLPRTQSRNGLALLCRLARSTLTEPSRTSRTESLRYQYFVTCHPGLEQAVAQELTSTRIGAKNVALCRTGVAFSSDSLETGYRANLWLRSAIRVLVLLFQANLDVNQRAGDEIYEYVKQAADWASLLPAGVSFKVDVRVGLSASSWAPHSLLCDRIRDAICDSIRDKRGQRPAPPSSYGAVVPLFATLHQDKRGDMALALHRDMSGHSLHRRGYRDVMHRAALNEAVAAGMLLLAGWEQAAAQGAALVDPMCGSGTLLLEGCMIARGVAPGLRRAAWPFMLWPDYSPSVWKGCVADAADAHKPWPGKLLGCDLHQGALTLARRDAKAAGLSPSALVLHQGDCARWQPPSAPGLVVTNPPWGLRLQAGATDNTRRHLDGRRLSGRQAGGDSAESWRHHGAAVHDARDAPGAAVDEDPAYVRDSWQSLGTFLWEQCQGVSAFVLCGNADATRALRLRATRRIPLVLGGLDLRLLQYDVRRRTQPATQPAPAPARLPQQFVEKRDMQHGSQAALVHLAPQVALPDSAPGQSVGQAGIEPLTPHRLAAKSPHHGSQNTSVLAALRSTRRLVGGKRLHLAEEP